MTLTSGPPRGLATPAPNISAPFVFAPSVCPHLACMSARMLVVVHPPLFSQVASADTGSALYTQAPKPGPLLVVKGF